MNPRTKQSSWTGLEIFAFSAFIFWSLVGLVFTFRHITEAVVEQWQLPPFLHEFIGLCIQFGDPTLIFLAFVNTHLQAVRQWSAGVARRWAMIVVILAYGIEEFGSRTGIPFGEYRYTGNFGPMLYEVPLTIPLAWHVVITNALFLIRSIAPHISRLMEAGMVGLIAVTYDFILEPFASEIKLYWIWREKSVPPLNYAAWFILSAVLTRLFAPTISSRYRLDPRPALILIFTIMIFIAGQWKH